MGDRDAIPPANRAEYQFQPGKSGNPCGRSKAEQAARRLVVDRILEKTENLEKLVDLLVRVALGQEPTLSDPKSRCYAIRELLDRAIGRAPMDVGVTLGSTVTPEQQAALEALKMSPFERRKRIEELRTPRPAPAPLLPAPDPGPDDPVH